MLVSFLSLEDALLPESDYLPNPGLHLPIQRLRLLHDEADGLVDGFVNGRAELRDDLLYLFSHVSEANVAGEESDNDGHRPRHSPFDVGDGGVELAVCDVSNGVYDGLDESD